MQGLRIDYALCSKGLLQHVKSCDILLDLPPKWSDHAPVLLELDLPAAAAPASQAPQQQIACPMWQQLLKQFADPSQRSIASMFRATGTSRPQPLAGSIPAAHGNKTATATSGQPAAAAAAPQAARDAGTPAVSEDGQYRQSMGGSIGRGSKRPYQQHREPPTTPAADPAAKQAKTQAADPLTGQPAAAVDGVIPSPGTDEQVDDPAAAQLQGFQPEQQQQSQQQSEQLAGQDSIAGSKQGAPTESTKLPSRRGPSSRAASKQSMQKVGDNSRAGGPRQAKLQSFFTAAAKFE